MRSHLSSSTWTRVAASCSRGEELQREGCLARWCSPGKMTPGYLTLSSRNQAQEPLGLLLMVEAHLHDRLHTNVNEASWEGARRKHTGSIVTPGEPVGRWGAPRPTFSQSNALQSSAEEHVSRPAPRML